ncbi:hypothetical protein N0V93_001989 [Gnomoniopsis smithogilvyi]|uniref:Uncharacterized protein n=1 Tax=Gnomoniopsis smithogilvyi TaxID=1191159 RepID=A0A9W8Z4T8_9PEZI|nr:hypothetical protein N0V93_001989 [Gnomoniopsis smithogilvyi]
MQPTTSLRDAIVAAIILSPAFITGLSLPWNFHNALAARAPTLSGGLDHAFAKEVRANADVNINHHNEERHASDDDSDDEDSELPTGTGQGFPTGFGGGGATGFPRPTGAFGSSGFGSGCPSGALPSGTGSPFGQFGARAAKKGKQAAMPTNFPTGCGGFGSGGQAAPTGSPFKA